MPFISNQDKEGKIGQRVSLDHDVTVLAGMFTAGTKMTIRGFGERGYDLEDDEGNWLYETGPFVKFTHVY